MYFRYFLGGLYYFIGLTSRFVTESQDIVYLCVEVLSFFQELMGNELMFYCFPPFCCKTYLILHSLIPLFHKGVLEKKNQSIPLIVLIYSDCDVLGFLNQHHKKDKTLCFKKFESLKEKLFH